MRSSLGLAAEAVAAIQLDYASKGQSLAQAVLCGSPHFVEWRHYPCNDLMDAKSGYEFYYHAHSADQIGFNEHGHFHVFKRDLVDQSLFTHLLGISLNQKGVPARIFTTNRWVTGERFQWADRVMHDVRNFQLQARARMAPIARWLTAFIRLFEDDIEQIVLARDLKLATLSEGCAFHEVLEMREHHILTQCNIDLIGRLQMHMSAINK